MNEVLQALGSSPPAAMLRGSFYLYPLVNAAHILAIGTLFATALLMDISVLGAPRRISAKEAIHLLRPFAIAALLLALLTGFLLFIVRPGEYVANPAFRIKMVLLVLAATNALAFTFLPPPSPVPAPTHRLLALASVSLWAAVAIAGRFIGFIE